MPDGVGATIKRVADRAVLRGHDITDANSMYKVVKPNTTIKLYSIQDEAFVKTKSDYGVGGLSIPTVPGTMRIHQIMTDTPGKISYRNVSCYCSSGKMCDCYELKHFCFPVLTVTTAADTLAPTEVELRDASCKSLIDEYVVVKYDGVAYPGIVTDEDHDDVEVKCLHKVGENRFYWPMHDDICWHQRDSILGVIPPLEKVTGRHVRVAPALWEKILTRM